MDGSQLKTDYPVVLRFEGLYPHQLGGYEAHRFRKGGDLGHIDRSRSELNQRLIGPEDWAACALAEIKEMTAENFAAELDSLERRNRKKDLERRIVDGPKQPWRATRHGPMREVILTVNKDWFDGDLSEFFGEGENQREKAFGELTRDWLIENFGRDVIHARADRNEAAFHVHAVIMPRSTVTIAKPKAKVKTASATRRMLQPSIHPLIKDYEAAQDSVGAWFESLGLVRGERRAEAIREARKKGTSHRNVGITQELRNGVRRKSCVSNPKPKPWRAPALLWTNARRHWPRKKTRPRPFFPWRRAWPRAPSPRKLMRTTPI